MQEPAETALGHGLICLLKHAPFLGCGSGTGYPTSHHRLSEGLPVTALLSRLPPSIPACALPFKHYERDLLSSSLGCLLSVTL
jgi:hypothetical protein